jgi:hypothetical protein
MNLVSALHGVVEQSHRDQLLIELEPMQQAGYLADVFEEETPIRRTALRAMCLSREREGIAQVLGCLRTPLTRVAWAATIS